MKKRLSFHADAAYRFYRSRCEDDSARRRGKIQSKNKIKRKHENVIRVRYYRCLFLAQMPSLNLPLVAVYFLLLKLMPPAKMVTFSVFLFLSLFIKFNERKAKARKRNYKSEEEKETWMTIINSTLMSRRGSNYCTPDSLGICWCCCLQKNSKKLRRRKVHRPVVVVFLDPHQVDNVLQANTTSLGICGVTFR